MNQICERIANNLILNNHCNNEDKNLIVFGLEVIVTTTITILSVLIISLILFNDIMFSIFFILPFILIRKYSGGYHAKTYMGCLILTNIMFVISTISSLNSNNQIILNIILMIVSGIYIYFRSPIINKENPLSDKDIKKNRRYCRASIIFLMCCYLLLIYLSINFKYINVLTNSTVIVAVLILISDLGGRKNEQKNIRKIN